MDEDVCEEQPIVFNGYVRLSVVISSLQKNLERVKSDRVGPLNLKNSEVFIMYMLHDNPDGLSAEQLSQACRLDRSLISRSLPDLKEKGYIEFRDLPANKRRYGSKITLTESGREVGDKLIWWATKIQSYLDSGIPREHLEIMYQTLDKLREGFERLNRDPQLGMGLFPDVQKTEVSGTDKE